MKAEPAPLDTAIESPPLRAKGRAASNFALLTGCRGHPCRPPSRRLFLATFLIGVRFLASSTMLTSSLLPLQPRIIILQANRIRIPLNINVLAIALLRVDHSRTKILAALPRRKTIDMLPLRQRRLPLQPPPRTINRRRKKDPADQHGCREMPKSRTGSIALIRHSTGILRFALE